MIFDSFSSTKPPSTLTTLDLIGYAVGIGAGQSDCKDGPHSAQASGLSQRLTDGRAVKAQWRSIVLGKDDALSDLNARIDAICRHVHALALSVRDSLLAGHFPVVIGGDHSSAMGTFSGVKAYLDQQSTSDDGGAEFGLIWIDAHLDAHTTETSLSKNIHGMPLAALLGGGDARLTHIVSHPPVLDPSRLCMIGIRSYQEAELAFLRGHNVRIMMMDEVVERGIAACLNEAHQIASKNDGRYSITLDIDGLDPLYAPGTGMHEPNGIFPKELIASLKTLPTQGLLALEIAEYAPINDKDNQTLDIIEGVIKASCENV